MGRLSVGPAAVPRPGSRTHHPRTRRP
jgi:hypothetical protein